MQAVMQVDIAYNTAERILLQLYQAIPRLLIAAIVVVVLYYAGKWFQLGVLAGRTRWRGRENLERAVSRIFQSILIAVSLLIAATVVFPTVTAASLIQLLGISGIAVGFAFRDIFQNFLAGILLLVTEPFSIGDEISVSGFEGMVEDVQTRATVIRTYDHRRVVVPNATLFTQSVVVNTAFAARRSEYDIVVLASSNIVELKRRIAQRLNSGIAGLARTPQAEVYLIKTDVTNATLRVNWWTNPRQRDALAVQDRVMEAVREELLAENSRKQEAESREQGVQQG